ncbi:hypothetical protein ACFLRC_01120 [Candidatus Altiarchaeota archaeon]
MDPIESISYASAVFVDTFPVGKKAAFSMDLETKVTIKEGKKGKGVVVKGKCGKTAKAVSSQVLKSFKSKLKDLNISVSSQIPADGGLGFEESVAAATSLATVCFIAGGRTYEFLVDKFLRRQFVAVDKRAVLPEELLTLCMKAEPKLSFARLCSSFYGGFVVVDERKKDVLRRGEMEENLKPVVIPLKSKTSKSTTSLSAGCEVAFQEALKGNLYTAMDLYSGLSFPDKKLLDEMKSKEPIAVVYSKPDLIPLFRGKKVKHGLKGKAIEIPVNNKQAHILAKPKKILRINEFLEMKPEGQWRWL